MHMILWDVLEVICIVYLEIFRFCLEAFEVSLNHTAIENLRSFILIATNILEVDTL